MLELDNEADSIIQLVLTTCLAQVRTDVKCCRSQTAQPLKHYRQPLSTVKGNSDCSLFSLSVEEQNSLLFQEK